MKLIRKGSMKDITGVYLGVMRQDPPTSFLNRFSTSFTTKTELTITKLRVAMADAILFK